MRGTPLSGALLAVLLERERPTHAYRLGTLLGRRLGPAWQVTPQSVYRLLERLEKNGLVSSKLETAKSPRRAGAGPQKVYAPTDRAEGALADWMQEDVSKVPVRVALQAKIAVSRVAHVPQLLKALEEYERECFEMLRETSEAEVQMSTWAGLAMNLTRVAADEHLNAELRWIVRAREWIEDFVAQS
jgi:DNA-binding PadR family transcriptional regulator